MREAGNCSVMGLSINPNDPDPAFVAAMSEARLLVTAVASKDVQKAEQINRVVIETLPAGIPDSVAEAHARQLLALSPLALELMLAGAVLGHGGRAAVKSPSREEWWQEHLPQALHLLDSERPQGPASLRQP